MWNCFQLEPVIIFQPTDIPWRRMGQRKIFGFVLPPGLYGIGKRCTRVLQIIPLCIQTDKQSQPDIRQQAQQFLMPKFCTLFTRRQIARWPLAWITKPHRDNRNLSAIIKNMFTDVHPCTQTLAAHVIPGYATLMHFNARCLTNDEDSGTSFCPQDWIRSKRQLRLTVATGTNLGKQPVQLRYSRHQINALPSDQGQLWRLRIR